MLSSIEGNLGSLKIIVFILELFKKEGKKWKLG